MSLSKAWDKVFGGFPPIQGVRWFDVFILLLMPALSVYGMMHVPLKAETAYLSAFFYFWSMLGVMAGYHRLWSHRSYNASLPLQLFLVGGGSAALQGSAFWWARSHRSHHRHIDTDKDPYNANRGLLWTHMGWMLFTSPLHSGPADISDLKQDKLLQFQHRHFFPIAIVLGVILPIVIPGYYFNDWLGGLCYTMAFRMTIAHHGTFSLNSIAHWLGSAPFDDVHTPRDHFISAVVTMGEGYHNFHHQFPMDYRNAFLWYQYDPTKWFIAFCGMVGLAHHLRKFPSNEIKKGQISMKLKNLKDFQDSIKWPLEPEQLPVVNWETFQEESKTKSLILISGFIHDVTQFADQHPGGKSHILNNSGKDMTAAFFGGTYEHSNAAHNLLSMMRVGILLNGVQTPTDAEVKASQEKFSKIPPGQRLFIAERT